MCDQHKLLMTDQTHVAVKCLLFDSVLKNSYGLLEIGNQLFRWSKSFQSSFLVFEEFFLVSRQLFVQGALLSLRAIRRL